MDTDTNDCAICLSQVEHGACTRLPCGHAFHPHCITQWETSRSHSLLAVTCPLCRKPYTPSFGGVINHVAVARNLIHDFERSTEFYENLRIQPGSLLYATLGYSLPSEVRVERPFPQALESNTRQVGGLISTWR